MVSNKIGKIRIEVREIRPSILLFDSIERGWKSGVHVRYLYIGSVVPIGLYSLCEVIDGLPCVMHMCISCCGCR